jgi:hypothetical protein
MEMAIARISGMPERSKAGSNKNMGKVRLRSGQPNHGIFRIILSREERQRIRPRFLLAEVASCSVFLFNLLRHVRGQTTCNLKVTLKIVPYRSRGARHPLVQVVLQH